MSDKIKLYQENNKKIGANSDIFDHKARIFAIL